MDKFFEEYFGDADGIGFLFRLIALLITVAMVIMIVTTFIPLSLLLIPLGCVIYTIYRTIKTYMGTTEYE